MIQIVYGEVVVAVETHEIMPVSLVVAEEEILAVHAAVILPPLFSLLYGLSFGVVVVGEWYVMFSEIVQYCFFACHDSKVFCPVYSPE